MDPISQTVALGGEDATLMAPASTKAYKPGVSGDYTPNAPVNLAVRGVTESKIEHVVGAVGAFTIQASSLPPGMKAMESKLVWRGETWTVLKWRERRWRGVINGYTLYLGV